MRKLLARLLYIVGARLETLSFFIHQTEAFDQMEREQQRLLKWAADHEASN